MKRCLKILAMIVSILCATQIFSGEFGFAAQNIAYAEETGYLLPGSDEFNNPVLGSQWSIINPSGSKVSLTSVNGELKLNSSAGDLYQTGNNAKNLILETAPTVTKWTIKTKMDYKPFGSSYEQGGIIVYQDMDNYVRLQRVRNTSVGNTFIEFSVETAGRYTQLGCIIEPNDAAETLYLKIEKNDNGYLGYYSYNNDTYLPAGTRVNISLNNSKVGLNAINGDLGAAYFDYFRVYGDVLPTLVNEETPQDVLSGSDEFNNTIPGNQWSIVNETLPSGSKWNLTSIPGRLKINSTSGDFYTTNNNAKNVIVQAAPNKQDWIIKTKMDYKPYSSSYQQAGIVVYQNMDNYIRLQRVRNTSVGNTFIEYSVEINGRYTQLGCVIEPNDSPGTIYFKIDRNASGYAGFYSYDDITYFPVGSRYNTSLSNIKVGLNAINGDLGAAYFDYFRMYSDGAGANDNTPPSQPLNLRIASKIVNTSVSLQWDAATDDVGVTGYDILNGSTVISTVNSTQCTLTNLPIGSSYTFTVKARDLAGNVSASSNILSGTVGTVVSGTISQDTVWIPQNGPYYVHSDLTVAQGVNLKILPGTLVKINPINGINAITKIIVNGSLTVSGSNTDKVIFTAFKDPQYEGNNSGFGWGSICISATGEANIDNAVFRCLEAQSGQGVVSANGKLQMTNCEITNGSIGVYVNSNNSVIVQNTSITNCSTGIAIDNASNGSVSILNNIISNCSWGGIDLRQFGSGSFAVQANYIQNNQGFPIYANLSGHTTPILRYVSDNTILGNQYSGENCNGIVIGGIINENIVLPKNTYIIGTSGTFTVPENLTLTIEPGAVIKTFNCSASIMIRGILNAQGTAQEPITFTSISDPSYGGNGYFSYLEYGGIINIQSTGTFNGDNVIVRCGGAAIIPQGTSGGYPSIYVEGRLNLTNSKVQDLKGLINVIGIWFNTAVQPTLLHNSFGLGGDYAVYNSRASEITIDARYNFWSSADGPSVYMNGWVGNGARVGAGISYSPFLDLI